MSGQDPTQDPAPDPDRPADGPALLLVHWSDDWTAALAEGLQHMPGLRLVRAGGLAEGLAAAVPDVAAVVLALDLPDSQGIATLDAMRAARPTAAVIALAADDDTTLHRLALRHGAAEVIVTGGMAAADAARAVREAVLRLRALELRRALAPGTTSSVVHDFNNVFQIIVNATEELGEAGLPHSLMHSVEAIRAAAGRGITLTRQLQAGGVRGRDGRKAD